MNKDNIWLLNLFYAYDQQQTFNRCSLCFHTLLRNLHLALDNRNHWKDSVIYSLCEY